jgi:hypothetical protein
MDCDWNSLFFCARGGRGGAPRSTRRTALAPQSAHAARESARSTISYCKFNSQYQPAAHTERSPRQGRTAYGRTVTPSNPSMRSTSEPHTHIFARLASLLLVVMPIPRIEPPHQSGVPGAATNAHLAKSWPDAASSLPSQTCSAGAVAATARGALVSPCEAVLRQHLACRSRRMHVPTRRASATCGSSNQAASGAARRHVFR